MLKGTNLKYANTFNLRIVLEVIRLHGPLSRIDISRGTQLTAQTVTNIVKKLLKADLIYEAERQQSGRGAPSILLKINPTAGYSIGIDFDKDHLTCVLVDLDGEIYQRLSIDLDFPTPDQAMDLICDNVNELIRKSGLRRENIWGIGVGLPGPMLILNGSVRANAVNPRFFPGWVNVPVAKILEERLKIPVYIENNASAAAIGERWYGAGKHVGTFFYIFFGAGLGGGLFINGQLFSGYMGNAGELGYMPVNNTKPEKIYSGEIPHLGMYFDLLILYNDLKNERIGVKNLTELEGLFLRKQNTVMNWLEKGSEQLGRSILAIEYLIDPETIFFGGRLPKSIIKKIIELSKEVAIKNRIPNLKEMVSLQIAAAGEDATALGSATLPFYNSFAPIPNLLQKKTGDISDEIKKGKNNILNID